jgi:hypothetical protein
MDYTIPSQIRITSTVTYDVRWAQEFPPAAETKDHHPGRYDGECSYEKKQIVLVLGQTPRRTFFSFLHEVLHAINFEAKEKSALHKKPLTESQICELEEAFSRILKLNKLG